MQVTSLLTQHEHDHGHDHHEHGPECGCGHEHAPVRLRQTLIGVIFVINAFVVDWAFDQGHTIASASAFIGAIILGYPIVLTAIKDMRKGILSINELVAIAVLAAFGSAAFGNDAGGGYKMAGLVAFFMLMGEIIETRTAEGARASIESLIKLTPTKARRINVLPRNPALPARRQQHFPKPRRKLPPANWPSATSSASGPAIMLLRTA